jgi:O-antigen/teichoic acid export membrane protein
LGKYTGDQTDIIIAWILLICINCYSVYTLYYDSLLTGKGYIKESQQINILGQFFYLVLAIVLIMFGFGLTAIVASQLISIVIRRILCYKVFFTPQLKEKLINAGCQDSIQILKAIYPNAIKSGLTSIGGFLVNKSSVFLCSMFLPLQATACLGITLQIMELLSRCGVVVYTSTLPMIAQYRVERNMDALKQLYVYSVLSLVAVFIAGGVAIVLFGNPILQLLHSETLLLPSAMLCVITVIFFLEENHIIAAGYIMADNRIPFFIPSLISGAATVALMLFFMGVLDMGLWGAILAPGIAQLAYQNWKWPSVVIKELWSK